MFEIVVGEDELLKELSEMAHYWPWAIEDLRVGYPYPHVAMISKSCTVLVHEDREKVH